MGLTKPRAAQIFNLDYKQATRVVTVSNITLSGGAPAVVDGVTLAEDDRVLVTGQSTGTQNGLYIVSTVGTGSDGTWARTSDGNETGEIEAGMIVMVTEGTIYADTQWKLITDNPITIGSTVLTFTQNYSANSISGGTSNVTVYSNSNVTISSAGTANVLTVSSTGIVVTGTISATGNVTGGNLLTVGFLSASGNITGNYILGNGSQLTGIASGSSDANALTGNTLAANVVNSSLTSVGTLSSLSVTGNVNAGNLRTAGLISATGTVTGSSLTGTITTAAQTNITSVGTLSSLSVTGNVNAGNLRTGGLISATGDITSAGNVAALNFNSTSADLAEKYEADSDYAPGTVVVFGGTKEITVSSTSHNTAVAGIISTAPSYLMNAGQAGEWVLPVALTGRVPCQVQGPVNKGTVLVTGSIPGTAMALDVSKFEPGCVVGKSLEIINSTDVLTIEVAVGRL